MSSTEVVNQMSFQERLKERVQNDIGDLMTDEDLSQIVKAVFHDAFFKPRKRTQGYRDIEEPPLIQELIVEQLRVQVQEVLKDYLADPENAVASVIEEKFEENIGAYVVKGLANVFSSALANLSMNVTDRINEIQQGNY